jgi:hypothetical protein
VGLPFYSARLKLERAQDHIECLADLVETWLETDAYTISSEIDPKTGYTVRRAKIKAPPPDQISIVAGDAVQNLRTAPEVSCLRSSPCRSLLSLLTTLLSLEGRGRETPKCPIGLMRPHVRLFLLGFDEASAR